MDSPQLEEAWDAFCSFIKAHRPLAEYSNWIAPIQVLKSTESSLVLSVPNIFVQDYLIENYQEEFFSFLPSELQGKCQLFFIVESSIEKSKEPEELDPGLKSPLLPSLNRHYTFENFIEGPSNQFVKSAAIGVAMRPGKTYNPLVIHGGVGLGKTHLLHSIAHFISARHPKLQVQCITTEAFVNDLVQSLKNRSVDHLKRHYRSLDVLLVDDIQFLQNKKNFEEEFSSMFEALIHQGKQIVITSDKPPQQLGFSDRLTARMEWGLVASVGVPDLETRVAILQHKADKKGLTLKQSIAFFIAEHVVQNVRQLEGAVNRLSAYCKLMGTEATEEVVEKTLAEILHQAPKKRITVESIIKSVAATFDIGPQELKSSSRTKHIAFPRQVAMYLAKELISSDSLSRLASFFGGKTHSTLLHSWQKIKKQMEQDQEMREQIERVRGSLIDLP